ncbi:Protein cft1 [Pleurostoma richardsiae]|uniref:Protein CFT1 n=1 Tax=Pleurostoma richardsiae TaxID=41990 RepID=A0AA38RP35_9PEZI|nr:Protein cft1 [Pleurostoma richardsiae]
MQCYSELTPPTAVTHSIALPFLSAQGSNLVVAKSSLLQIFKTKTISAELDSSQSAAATAQQSTKSATQYDSRLNDDDGLESSFLGGDSVLVRSDRSNNTKVVLVAEFPLSGTVTGLARIKTQSSKSGGEALLILFRDAKLSLVEWDPDQLALSTVSIHYYEQEELQGSPWVPPLSDFVNALTADPGSRCAALKFGARNLAILPFKHADEDIDMDGWDEELDGPRPGKDLPSAPVNGVSNNIEDTPYSPSFVLRLSNLDPSLLHPVHLAFLHEYREPTFGILSSTLSPSAALGRKDHLSYMVFTLDLQQKASTTILSVGGLPQDLFEVIALPPPVGGALLAGSNELIHIDQSGKVNGVAVNPFTRQCTGFSMADQSSLGLRLEGCTIELISVETGELLLVLQDGRLGLINFQIDGRTVSGLHVKLVSPEAGGSAIPYAISTTSRLGRNVLFAGSEEGDSLVLGWSRKQSQALRRKSRINETALDHDVDDDDLDEDDEDDLYGDGPSVAKTVQTPAATAKGGELVFRVHDRLTSIAPIRDITYGKASFLADSEEEKNSADVRSDLQLVAAVGRGGAGALAILTREIQPKVIGRFEFPEARGLWTMSAQKPIPKSLQGDKGGNTVGNDYDASTQYDKYMIVAKIDLDGYETSDVYALSSAGFESLTGTEFEPAAGFTIEAGTMARHRKIVQVLKSEVRCYDGDLGLDQILPMLDEETGAEPRVISASISDPYLLLIRDDSSTFIAQMNKHDELEELEKEDDKLLSTKWLTGCLYADIHGVFDEAQTDKGIKSGENIIMFLLSSSGALYVYALPDLSRPIYVAEGLSYVPPVLSADFAARRGTAKEAITEVLIADLGDTTSKSPYLILRHANDDLTIYEPVRYNLGNTPELTKSLRFYKRPNSTFAKSPMEADQDDATHEPRNLPLRVCSNIAGYSTVFMPGASASFIIKSSQSMPRVLGLQGSGVRAMSSFHTEGCEHGFIYADSLGISRVTQLPADCSYSEVGMSLKKVPVGLDVNVVAHHPPTGVYAVGCSVTEPFELPKDDDYHREWARENIIFKPMTERGLLKLLSPVTWTVIDTVEMEPNEIIMCIKTLNLEVSESTNERKQLITVGTAISRGEDLPIRGRIHVYDVATVIPEPGKPETDKKLKLVAKEDIPRGAVTALSEVGTQGLMLVAQGQKCMVRGLKEDGTLLPVAFMDMNCYVTSVKELPGTGLCLMSDAFKGVWFTGYTEEPYKMMLFGKSNTSLEVLNADFLPDGRELFIVAADADGNIHILQFDPEHPKSLQGHLLLHRTSFCAGANLPTTSLLLPRTVPPQSPLAQQENGTTNGEDTSTLPPHVLLLASPTGALASLTALPENSYRRLSSLASQLATSLPHAAALNPKAYRLATSASSAGGGAGQTTARGPPGVDAGVGRSIVDGALLARWGELGSGRRAEVAGRVGFAGAEEVRGELEGVLGWGMMAYF